MSNVMTDVELLSARIKRLEQDSEQAWKEVEEVNIRNSELEHEIYELRRTLAGDDSSTVARLLGEIAELQETEAQRWELLSCRANSLDLEGAQRQYEYHLEWAMRGEIPASRAADFYETLSSKCYAWSRAFRELQKKLEAKRENTSTNT